MPKKYTRKRLKRTYKRRRSRTRKFGLVNRLRYFKQKCTQVIPVTSVDAAANFQTFVFSRFDFSGLISNVKGVDSAPRFNACKANYEQFSITGIKLRWYPSNVTGTVDPTTTGRVGGQLVYLWTYEDIDTYDIQNYDNNKIVALESFKAYDPKRAMKIYRSNSKIARQ